MTHIMKGDPDSTIVREFNGDEMKAVSKFVFFNEKLQFKFVPHLQVLTANSVVCTRNYKAE